MTKEEVPSGNTSEQPKESNNKSLYEVVGQVVSKIGHEPFLFAIGVAALLVGLATVATELGSSDFRIIVIVIGSLSFLVIIGYYLREVLTQTPNHQPPKTLIPPIFPESKKFEELSTFSEKKDELIHPFQTRIERGNLELTEEQQSGCVASPWDFDRIVVYLHEENSKKPGFNDRLQHVTREWEKLRAMEGRRSLIPLHYSIRSILGFLERHEELSKEAPLSLAFFRQIQEYLKARPEIDQGGEVKTNITNIIRIIG